MLYSQNCEHMIVMSVPTQQQKIFYIRVYRACEIQKVTLLFDHTSYEGRTELLPITKEKYISFTKYVDSIKNDQQKTYVKMYFIDSFKFLSTSLEKLASYLDKDKLKTKQSEFFNLSAKDFDLLTCKGILLSSSRSLVFLVGGN